MLVPTLRADPSEKSAADTLIPVRRPAATISFAIAPCSLGFVIIAISEQFIRSIMVGDDPEMLVSDLQNQFPSDAIEVIENDDAGLIAKVVDSVEHLDAVIGAYVDIADAACADVQSRLAGNKCDNLESD